MTAPSGRMRPADLPYTDVCACGKPMGQCAAPHCGVLDPRAKPDERGQRVLRELELWADNWPEEMSQRLVDDARATVARLTAENEALRAALAEIAEGTGTFSPDRYEHVCNTIVEMKALATRALAPPATESETDG